ESLAIAADGGERVGRTISIGLSDDFEIALGRALIDAVTHEAAGIRLIFRQTHSGIAGDALLRHGVDLAIASGGFSANGLSRHAVATGGYACLIDPAGRARTPRTLTLAEFLRRDHLLVSSGGVIGIVDEALAALGHKRRVAASTTHFAALPYLLAGSDAVATIPAHAARAIAQATSLRALACPVDLPRYPVEIGWRTSTQRDPAIVRVRDAIAACIAQRVAP
ncbi:TPA: LysR substrate-binding domain-containing protein, partial [Burkholderia cenocepacia]